MNYVIQLIFKEKIVNSLNCHFSPKYCLVFSLSLHFYFEERESELSSAGLLPSACCGGGYSRGRGMRGWELGAELGDGNSIQVSYMDSWDQTLESYCCLPGGSHKLESGAGVRARN